MNPTNALLLGTGNAFKPVLSSLEHLFPDTTFAVLDAWAKVQEVKVLEEETATVDDCTVKFVRDLSYFIQPPVVDIRFDTTKYEDAEMQKITGYIPQQRELLQAQLQERFETVVEKLKTYNRILITCNAYDPLALAWLLPVVKALQDKTAITVFSSYPAAFEGRMLTELANQFTEALIDTAVTHYIFFKQELAETHRLEVLKVFWDESKRIQAETIQCLLGETAAPSPYITII